MLQDGGATSYRTAGEGVRAPSAADTSEVERQAKKWSTATLECRSYGHLWRPSTAQHFPKLRYWYVVRKCGRCTTERHEELDEYGRVFSKWYRYAEGYLTENLGRITGDGRGVLRLQTVLRTFKVQSIEHDDDVDAARPRSQATRDSIGWRH